ncbi:hypothetical protein BH10ACI1_BH10ACI1_04640 [soil metagenome]
MFRSKKKSEFKRKLLIILKVGNFLFLICFLILIQSSCFIAEHLKAQQVRKEQAIKDLRELCNDLVPPEDFGKRPAVESIDVSKVVISFHYKSNGDCEDTANHYKKLLEEKGWDMSKMTQHISRGGMSTIDTNFRNGEYLVTVSCENTLEKNELKQQSLDCSWGLE